MGGETLDSRPQGETLVESILPRLAQLKSSRLPDGKSAYSTCIHSCIQGLLDLRANDWIGEVERPDWAHEWGWRVGANEPIANKVFAEAPSTRARKQSPPQ